ncbi:family 20 glycosylhydrolase [Solihabitans fulvus]|uniref:beta-N-acetylhexosaminidase n=1 Tax=Solihabitans fulvus TaxID=1892852 RepID=A0A5B2XE35_9PSEU|nr:family 20 glycosylhydrolase [Solihabitans fulvus]
MRRTAGTLLLAAALGLAVTTFGGSATAATPRSAYLNVVPAPVSAQPNAAAAYPITANTRIYVDPSANQVGDYLAGILRRSTGFPLPITPAPATPTDGIALLLTGAGTQVGAQGYQLDASTAKVVIRAQTVDGLRAGVQTLRQLLPAKADSPTVQSGPWAVPGGHVLDYPRFAQRGAMLDVARHFFPVGTVKRYIDEIALYKVNVLHLHLADDQGWRIEIKSWPKLATYGGSTEVGGGPGGYYTQADYQGIVAYAQSRGVTVIPEIDMPGHTNAALASYAELNCNGVAPPLYTGTDVGFSSLCISKDVTYTFLDDVIRELSALTPSPYLHIGGDEAKVTSDPDYIAFEQKVFPILQKYGKHAEGWHDFLKANPPTSAVPEFWGTTNSDANVTAAAQRGTKILLAPANKTYLDMKYNSSTPLGQNWAGYIEVKTAFNWNPGSYLQGVPESAIAGVEAPLWSETLVTTRDIEYMAFPRLPTIAELGWSPAATHNWTAFRARLGAQAPRWKVLGINYYPSSQIVWAK